jgi:hypothetical protein
MKVIHAPAQAEVREERERRYLKAWPIEKQLEAYAEALQGRTEKRDQMLEDFAAIREALPFYEEG